MGEKAMNRRNFFQAMLATATAPAIVRAESLMRIIAPPMDIIVPPMGILAPPTRPNRLLTIEMITQEALKILEQQMTSAWGNCNQLYDLEFTPAPRLKVVKK